MQRSIELYNKLHECCREALSIADANAEGCNFYDNEATQKAFDDFHRDYSNFCEEQNTVEGEPFTQDPPNIAHYLALHKATKRANRKLKIGVTAPPVMDFPMRGPKVEKKPIQLRKLEPKRVAKAPPTATILEEVKEKAKEEPLVKASAPPVSFEAYVKLNPSVCDKNNLIFLPKAYEAEMLKSPAKFVHRHVFPNKQKVISKIKEWKSFMKAGEVKKAADITIRSMDGKDRLIGSIAFSFKSFDRYCNNEDKEQYVTLLCNFIK